MRFDSNFYRSTDIHGICRRLLGSVLQVESDGHLCSGRIVELEAYLAPEDPASHAFAGRRTPKNEMMYAPGGACYMYICYGIHHMCNIVTNEEEVPHAILIRALEPVEGLEIMYERRGLAKNDRNLTGGPGRLCQAMGLDMSHNGLDFPTSDILHIVPRGNIQGRDIVQTTRIGLARGESLPYRYYIKDNKWVSRY